MKKKSLALALALIMLLGVLSACGSTKQEEIGGALGDVGGVTPPPAAPATPSAVPTLDPATPPAETAPVDTQPSAQPTDSGGGQDINLDDFLYDWLDFSGYPLTPDELIEFFGEPQERVSVESTLDYSTCGLPGYEDAGTVQTEILSYSNVLFMFFVDPFDDNWTVQLVAVTDPTSIIKVGGATVGMSYYAGVRTAGFTEDEVVDDQTASGGRYAVRAFNSSGVMFELVCQGGNMGLYIGERYD